MRFTFLLLALALAAPAVSAQSSRNMSTERVQFARGTSGATLSDTVRPAATHRYLVNARRGQTLIADLQGGWEGVRIQVYAPGRSIVARNAAPRNDGDRFDLTGWDGRLSRSGDYQIAVYTAPGVRAPQSYDLEIRVVD